jgi:hypothetical protein
VQFETCVHVVGVGEAYCPELLRQYCALEIDPPPSLIPPIKTVCGTGPFDVSIFIVVMYGLKSL